jgi:hypothetical protein
MGYCWQVLADECAEALEAGLVAGLVFGAAGALIGAGIGALFSHYGPFESVNLEGSVPPLSSYGQGARGSRALP